MSTAPLPGLAERHTSPQDCLLVVGIPFEEQLFRQSLADPRSYASKHDRGAGAGTTWTIARNTYVNRCLPVFEEIRQLGGRILFPTSPAELAAAASGHSVVAPFTHAVWPSFAPEHALDAYALAERLRSHPEPSCQVFRAWLTGTHQPGAITERLPDAVLLHALAAASGLAHQTWAVRANLGQAGLPAPDDIHGQIAQYFARPELERLFPEHVQRSEGIELGGTLHSIADFFSDMLKGRSIILDLTMCNSGMAAKAIKEHSPQSLLIVNQYEMDPIFRLLTYKAVLQELASGPSSYIAANARIRNALLNQFKS